MKILVTGAAGFIGFHLCKSLIRSGCSVIGLDSINEYYDVNLKYSRLEELGINRTSISGYNVLVKSVTHPSFEFIKLNIEDRRKLPDLFQNEKIEIVCNMAAQAGVRYSLENPEAYIDGNIVGFGNLLECCKNHHVKHLVYASSSSVYGLNEKIPFNINDNVDNPISIYAASKKSNELMAFTYSHLYNFRTTGLRFFTVYGPWGRPDMAMFLFTKSIIEKTPIQVYNSGNLERDFTYIDDIIEGLVRIVMGNFTKSYDTKKLYHLYNIGNGNPVKLTDFIKAIELSLDLKAKKIMKPMQPGDVTRTWADVTNLKEDYGYRPNTPIKHGIEHFVLWYKKYYKS